MFKRRVIFLIIVIIFSFTSFSQAATLNLGEDVYKLQIAQFNGSMDDFITLNLGYGVNDDSGYGLEVITGNQIGVVHLEYQFVPPANQKNKDNFNSAFKVGAASGNYWKEDEPGGKVGLVLVKKEEQKEIYFDGDLIAGSTNLFDLELINIINIILKCS